MNPGPPGASLNASITAAWGMQSQAPPAVRKRVRKTMGLNSVGPDDGTVTPGSDGAATPVGAGPAGEASTSTRERPTSERDSRKKRVRRTVDDAAEKYAPPEARLSQLGGLGSQVTQLLEIVALPLLHPEIYVHTGVPRPKGVLLHGVPGGGKTQLVRCLAGELGLPFIPISAPSIVSGMSGESERALRETFDEAKVSLEIHSVSSLPETRTVHPLPRRGRCYHTKARDGAEGDGAPYCGPAPYLHGRYVFQLLFGRFEADKQTSLRLTSLSL